MAEHYFERESRTPNSESYVIEGEDGRLGRVDIHYAPGGAAYATLCVLERLTDEEIRDLIGEVDERLVMTADPYREDFVVTVWAGREVATYCDEDFETEEEEEEAEGNGHRL